MYQKTNEEELEEVKEEVMIHNITAVKAKIEELKAELAKYEEIIAENETYVKDEKTNLFVKEIGIE